MTQEVKCTELKTCGRLNELNISKPSIIYISASVISFPHKKVIIGAQKKIILRIKNMDKMATKNFNFKVLLLILVSRRPHAVAIVF